MRSAPLTWLLADDYGTSLGQFDLDFASPATSNVQLRGYYDFYSRPGFVLLDTTDSVGPYRVNDFLSFFSPTTGNTYRQDYGNGEFNEIRVNESVIQIGTLTTPLESAGGVFEVAIREFYSFDEITQYCDYYEEIYDDETGEVIATGPCASYSVEAYYNSESDDWYLGTLTSTPVSPVPLPPALPLLLSVGGLWAAGRRRPTQNQG
ncbi:MAG: hypothetical protein H6978_08055 [Gammaproteobacteria bacterium]|nr:hypothetical protein [Gammaproteobacteria bacterium]